MRSEHTQTLIDTDWGSMYKIVEEEFYPYRVDRLQTFAQWLQDHTKIDYYSPAILVRISAKLDPEIYHSDIDDDGEYHYWYIDTDGDSQEMPWDDWWVSPHIAYHDWKKRDGEQ